MNYLAHCYLSCSDEDLLLGNLITDFMKKSEEKNYTGQVLHGIGIHRKIDSFTDSHPASLRLREMLRTRHDKYAPVVVDLIWDYFLSIEWKKFSGADLRVFVEEIYVLLAKRKEELPAKFAKRLDSMIEADFLMSYSDKKRMRSALEWMDNRVKYPSNFVGALDDLEENQIEMELLFNQFFPELIDFVDTQCNC